MVFSVTHHGRQLLNLSFTFSRFRLGRASLRDTIQRAIGYSDRGHTHSSMRRSLWHKRLMTWKLRLPAKARQIKWPLASVRLDWSW